LNLEDPPYVNTRDGIYLNCLISTSRGVVMSLGRRIAIALVASVGLLLASVMPASGAEVGVPFTVELTGEAEVTSTGVPNQGDLDGSGTATLTVNPGLGEVCWSIEVTGVETISAAHIHKAPSTTTGGIVVHLNPYQGGCIKVSRELALAIITNPSSYYVNVHNADYPQGALRGQLTFAR
jgi:CHRD domain